MERTYIAILPEWIQRNMVGNIISRFENLSLKLIFIKMIQLDENEDYSTLTYYVSLNIFKSKYKGINLLISVFF